MKELLNGKGKLSTRNEQALRTLLNGTGRVMKQSGRGSWGKAVRRQETEIAIQVAARMKIVTTTGNDAPRGGQMGDFVNFRVTPAKRAKIEAFVDEHRVVSEWERSEEKRRAQHKADVQAAIERRKARHEELKAQGIEFRRLTAEDIELFLTNKTETQSVYDFRKERGLSWRALTDLLLACE